MQIFKTLASKMWIWEPIQNWELKLKNRRFQFLYREILDPNFSEGRKKLTEMARAFKYSYNVRNG